MIKLFFLLFSTISLNAQIKLMRMEDSCTFEYIGNIIDTLRVFYPLGGNKLLPMDFYVNISDDKKTRVVLTLIRFDLLKDDFESAIEGLHIEVEERDDNLKIGNRNFRFVSGTKVEKGLNMEYLVFASNSIDKVLVFSYNLDDWNDNFDLHFYKVLSTYKCR